MAALRSAVDGVHLDPAAGGIDEAVGAVIPALRDRGLLGPTAPARRGALRARLRLPRPAGRRAAQR